MYTLTPNEGWIYKIDTSQFIPSDELNTDYQDYLAWLEEGNEPEPWAGLAGTT